MIFILHTVVVIEDLNASTEENNVLLKITVNMAGELSSRNKSGSVCPGLTFYTLSYGA